MSPALVCGIKESGVDLMNPKDRVQDAIVIYYRNLIQYTLETIRHKLEAAQNMPTFMKPIDVVCGGPHGRSTDGQASDDRCDCCRECDAHGRTPLESRFPAGD